MEMVRILEKERSCWCQKVKGAELGILINFFKPDLHAVIVFP